jgi:O-antigen/teichoic acid export membrane protein
MLTSAITAAITVVLTWLGIPPGPYIAGVWIAVKVLLVGLVALIGWRAARRRSHAAPPPTGSG